MRHRLHPAMTRIFSILTNLFGKTIHVHASCSVVYVYAFAHLISVMFYVLHVRSCGFRVPSALSTLIKRNPSALYYLAVTAQRPWHMGTHDYCIRSVASARADSA